MPNILVVDDERSIRRTLVRFLSAEGYSVAEAEDVAAARELVSASFFDVVLTDIILPRATGIDLLRELADQTPDTLVIMMTGEPTVETATEAVRLGAFDYLVKPVAKERILQTVNNAVRVCMLNAEKRRLEELNRKYREELELLVDLRTSALRDSNAELVESNDKLRRHQEQLIQAEKMASLGQVAAGVAHEINNPIAYISSNLQMLRTLVDVLKSRIDHQQALIEAIEAGDAAAEKSARSALDNPAMGVGLDQALADIDDIVSESLNGTLRVRDVVNDLRTFAHVAADEPAPADINEIVESSLRMVWNQLKYKCKVTRDLQPLDPVVCFADSLSQVFMNLLVNAAQAIEDHGKVHISTKQTDQQVQISIRDSGSGIAPEHLGRLFEPFFTTKETGTGTGLGLSISQNTVHRHGGRIEVHSALGEGSTFVVVLPRTARPQPEEPGAGAAEA
jgi:signal transduction histidine kinase